MLRAANRQPWLPRGMTRRAPLLYTHGSLSSATAGQDTVDVSSLSLARLHGFALRTLAFESLLYDDMPPKWRKSLKKVLKK